MISNTTRRLAVLSVAAWGVFMHAWIAPLPIATVQWMITWMMVPVLCVPAIRRLSTTTPCYHRQNWHTRFWQLGYAILVGVGAVTLTASESMYGMLPVMSGGLVGLAVHQLNSDGKHHVMVWMTTATLVPSVFFGSLVPTILIAGVFAGLLLWAPDYAGVYAASDRFCVETTTYGHTEATRRTDGPSNACHNAWSSTVLAVVVVVCMVLMTESADLSPVGGHGVLMGTPVTPEVVAIAMTVTLCIVLCAVAVVVRFVYVSSDNLFRSAAFGLFSLAATSVNISAAQAGRLVSDCGSEPSNIAPGWAPVVFVSAGLSMSASIVVLQTFKWVQIRTLVVAAHGIVIVSGLAEIALRAHVLFIVLNSAFVYPIAWALHYVVVDGLVQHMYPKNVRSSTDRQCLYASYAAGTLVASWMGTVLIMYFNVRGIHSTTGCDFYYYPHLVTAARDVVPWVGIACAYAFFPNRSV